MRSLLTVTAVLEAATGLALLASPSTVALALLGEPLDGPVPFAVARVAGAALLALAVACWQARAEGQRLASRGVVWAMLLYNAAVVAVLTQAGLVAGLAGRGLWPAVILHAALAAWCVAALRNRTVVPEA